MLKPPPGKRLSPDDKAELTDISDQELFNAVLLYMPKLFQLLHLFQVLLLSTKSQHLKNAYESVMVFQRCLNACCEHCFVV